ncbi:MAG: LytTR family DNA-binding domain-containing protein [Firmicutes bacterium]|nr:LytTR family DNA-binding domain-containing protein [Bacillota bacterium]
MKIAICDDDPRDIGIIRGFVDSHKITHEVTEFTSAGPLRQRAEKDDFFDLVFLDIEMPGPDSDGWETALYLKQLKKYRTYIAMVTMHENYWKDCFDRVDWFASKPVTEENIHKILDKAQEKLFPHVLPFLIDRVNVSLNITEIFYFEARHNDVIINTVDKEYKCRMSINALADMIADYPCFVRTHRSY